MSLGPFTRSSQQAKLQETITSYQLGPPPWPAVPCRLRNFGNFQPWIPVKKKATVNHLRGNESVFLISTSFGGCLWELLLFPPCGEEEHPHLCARVGGWPAPSVLPVGTSSLPASYTPSRARDHSTTCRLPEDNSGISVGCPGCRHWALPSKQEKKGRCWLAWSVVLVLPPGKIMWYDYICQHGNFYSRVGKKNSFFQMYGMNIKH